MKKLLKKLALLPLFCGFILTSACSNDDENSNDNNNDIPTSWFDGTITATVVNGNDYNDLIYRVVARICCCFGETTSGSWSNGGFTLTLPATLDSRYLADWFENEENIVMSDRNARMNRELDLRAYNSDGEEVGDFMLSKEDGDKFVWVFFVYTDRDVTITGTTNDSEIQLIYNLSLKRGWNRVYITDLEIENGLRRDISSTPISGLRWHFYGGGSVD